MPLLRATMTLMPVSTNGTEKSMTSERSSLMVSEPMAMSARPDTTCRQGHQGAELPGVGLPGAGLPGAGLKGGGAERERG